MKPRVQFLSITSESDRLEVRVYRQTQDGNHTHKVYRNITRESCARLTALLEDYYNWSVFYKFGVIVYITNSHLIKAI